jgi:hypothetical protein
MPERMRARRAARIGLVIALTVSLFAFAPATRAATSSPPAAPRARVTEVPPGLHDFPFTLGCCYYDFNEIGYTLHEYLVSGTAKTYTKPSTTAPFTTRIIVALPKDRSRFNGTVLAEWENVTAVAPAQPGMVWMHHYMLPRGFGYMAISAQAVGVNLMRLWDPIRYASLSHPGDDYSFDIFSQAAAAIRSVPGGKGTKQLIGYGQSQSAGRLNTYANVAQNDAKVLNALIVQADGGTRKSFPNLTIPLIHLETEDSIVSTPPDKRNPKGLYRLWEVVGAAHIGDEETQSPGTFTLPLALTIGTPIPWDLDRRFWEHSHYGEEGPGLGLTCVGGTEMPVRYALDAALEAMRAWIATGVPAPQPPRASFDAAGVLRRDRFGNALGGLRLPPIQVPVATYSATTCGLLGSTTPFLPTQLLELYPTHESYVAKMQAATDRAVRDRIMVQADADQMMRKVRRSVIPLWRPSTQLGLFEGGI